MKDNLLSIKSLSSERGTGIVDYAMLVALITCVVLIGVQAVGSKSKTRFCDAAAAMDASQEGVGDGGNDCSAGGIEDGVNLDG